MPAWMAGIQVLRMRADTSMSDWIPALHAGMTESRSRTKTDRGPPPLVFSKEDMKDSEIITFQFLPSCASRPSWCNVSFDFGCGVAPLCHCGNISSQKTRNNQKIKTPHGFATGTVSLPSKGGEKTTNATAGSAAVLTK
jgi:hypothetical protein